MRTCLAGAHLQVPARPAQGPAPHATVWSPPRAHAILRILHNPAYAGAYVYGQHVVDPVRHQPGRPRSGVVRLPHGTVGRVPPRRVSGLYLVGDVSRQAGALAGQSACLRHRARGCPATAGPCSKGSRAAAAAGVGCASATRDRRATIPSIAALWRPRNTAACIARRCGPPAWMPPSNASSWRRWPPSALRWHSTHWGNWHRDRGLGAAVAGAPGAGTLCCAARPAPV